VVGVWRIGLSSAARCRRGVCDYGRIGLQLQELGDIRRDQCEVIVWIHRADPLFAFSQSRAIG
jgi:hypothetical protein